MTTWVFLRGLMREARHWGEFPALFRAAMPDAEIVALDLPGNGSLYRLPSPARVEDAAQGVRRELRARRIAPPYRVLALSLGAMVATAWGAAQPEELGGCVLINTSLRPFSPFYRRLRPRQYLALLRFACAQGDPVGRERLILRATSSQPERHGAALADWIAWRRECPVSRRNALRQLLAAARYVAPAHPPPFPVLVLAGARDALVDPRCSQRLAEGWGAPLALHPSAGHDLPLDDGPWAARRVKEWLASLGTPSQL